MTEFILAPGVFPFTVAIGIMFAIAILEGVGMVIGTGISAALETLLPDVDVDMPDASGGALTKILGWMNFGRVPILIILVCFLTAFGIVGYILQSFVASTFGFYLPGVMAVFAALAASLPFTRLFTSVMAKIIPKDETNAVVAEDFIGKTAVVTLGTASKGKPAEAKFTDRFGQVHYTMVEPKEEVITFIAGDEVILESPSTRGHYAFQLTKD